MGNIHFAQIILAMPDYLNINGKTISKLSILLIIITSHHFNVYRETSCWSNQVLKYNIIYLPQ